MRGGEVGGKQGRGGEHASARQSSIPVDGTAGEMHPTSGELMPGTAPAGTAAVPPRQLQHRHPSTATPTAGGAACLRLVHVELRGQPLHLLALLPQAGLQAGRYAAGAGCWRQYRRQCPAGGAEGPSDACCWRLAAGEGVQSICQQYTCDGVLCSRCCVHVLRPMAEAPPGTGSAARRLPAPAAVPGSTSAPGTAAPCPAGPVVEW